MATKNPFGKGRKISVKEFHGNYRKSKATQGFLSNEKISKIIDRENERGEFNRVIQGKSSDGLTGLEMREAIGEMKTLTETEKNRLAKEIFPNLPSGQRFIRPKNASQSKITLQNKIEKQPESKKGISPASRPSPGSSLDYEFAKPGFINNTDTAAPAQLSDSRPADTKAQMAALMNIARKKILDERENESGKSKGNFSSAIASTIRNKKTS